ncbi:hypothetical protein FNJ84_13485 [Paracoccus sp. M683]|uniref:hypothetical protein n=1 Tax=Paracoccus sp. M683 TaxID=2594268 RepID=UPI00117BF43F|nr:hypothetical protein [Paracoccus sp. M683]TRW96290.1 hypothetical protein FNJ84_13485 [Paracoccus sp. M683]
MADDRPAAAIVFDDCRTVNLQPGDYVLKVTQTMSATTINDQAVNIPDAFEAERDFTVAGPRFALSPGDIRAVYPADGADGDFSMVLPHVILTRPTLPWERSPIPSPNTPPDS